MRLIRCVFLRNCYVIGRVLDTEVRVSGPIASLISTNGETVFSALFNTIFLDVLPVSSVHNKEGEYTLDPIITSCLTDLRPLSSRQLFFVF